MIKLIIPKAVLWVTFSEAFHSQLYFFLLYVYSSPQLSPSCLAFTRAQTSATERSRNRHAILHPPHASTWPCSSLRTSVTPASPNNLFSALLSLIHSSLALRRPRSEAAFAQVTNVCVTKWNRFFSSSLPPSPQQHSIPLMSENCRPHPPAIERPPRHNCTCTCTFCFSHCASRLPHKSDQIPSLFPWMAATFPAHKANLGVTATPASFSPHTQFTAEPAGSAPQRPWNPPTSLHLQRHYPHSNCFRLLVSTRAFLLRLMKPNFSKCNAPSPARPCPWETDYSLQAGTWLGPFSVSPASSNTIFSRVPHLTHQTIWSKGQSCAHHYIFSV